MKLKSQTLLCKLCEKTTVRLTKVDDMTLPKCPYCTVGETGKIFEARARVYGSETKRQRDHVAGITRDVLAQQVDEIGHTLDTYKGMEKGQALVTPTMHMAQVENEVKQFKQTMGALPGMSLHQQHENIAQGMGFPSAQQMLMGARQEAMTANSMGLNPVGMLHGMLKGGRKV